MSDSTVEESETERSDGSERPDDHLEGIDDGCGCAEVWDYLSERRGDGTDADRSDGADDDGRTDEAADG